MVNGPMSPEFEACHTCDNPPCCNPAHIFPGTHLENSQDSVRKGRRPFGEAIPSARLTPDDVRAIRRALAAGESERKIASRFGVNKTAVHKISSGQTWGHVNDE
jgi:hypothetical protein